MIRVAARALGRRRRRRRRRRSSRLRGGGLGSILRIHVIQFKRRWTLSNILVTAWPRPFGWEERRGLHGDWINRFRCRLNRSRSRCDVMCQTACWASLRSSSWKSRVAVSSVEKCTCHLIVVEIDVLWVVRKFEARGLKEWRSKCTECPDVGMRDWKRMAGGKEVSGKW